MGKLIDSGIFNLAAIVGIGIIAIVELVRGNFRNFGIDLLLIAVNIPYAAKFFRRER